MCTVILLHRVLPGWPVFVAANRDELLVRPSEDFAPRSGPPEWFGPMDLRAGGTWMGIARTGLVVAVTNRYGKPPDASRRSRGELVPMLLAAATAEVAAERLTALNPLDYNAFHVVIADADHAFVGHAATGALTVTEVTAPLVVTERSFGAAPTEREAWLRPAVHALATSGTETPGAWQALLGTHRPSDEGGPPGIDGACAHTPGGLYGTRSSAVVAVGQPGEGRQAWLRTAWGAPCVTPFSQRDAELSAWLNGGGDQEAISTPPPPR